MNRRKIVSRAIGLALLFPMATFAQYQQFPTNDSRVNPIPVVPDNRVNQELYGNTGGSVRYPYQQALLPSEYEILVQQSGATPSQLLLQRQRVGPLAPNPYSYIPGQNPAPQWQALPAPLPVSPGSAAPTAPSDQPSNTLPAWGGESIRWGGPVTVLPENGDYILPLPENMRYGNGMNDAFGAGNPAGTPAVTTPQTRPTTVPTN